MNREDIERLIKYHEGDLADSMRHPAPEAHVDIHIKATRTTIAALRRLLAAMPRTGPVPEEMRDDGVVFYDGEVAYYAWGSRCLAVGKLPWVPAAAIFPKDEVKP